MKSLIVIGIRIVIGISPLGNSQIVRIIVSAATGG